MILLVDLPLFTYCAAGPIGWPLQAPSGALRCPCAGPEALTAANAGILFCCRHTQRGRLRGDMSRNYSLIYRRCSGKNRAEED
jgi:hypothetical protein